MMIFVIVFDEVFVDQRSLTLTTFFFRLCLGADDR